MIGAITLLCLLPLVSGQTATAEDTDLESLLEIEDRVAEILPEAIQKTVAIRVQVMGEVGFGSGAHIGEGYILTCAHVVEHAKQDDLIVVLSDGTEHEAERLGMCALNDYALIRIGREDFPAFDIEETPPEVGDWVGALGHPGGPYGDHQPAFSLGQVTALDKELPLFMFRKQYTRAIQTNTQIFAGNSGGPLFDLDGRLLGINGAILLINENAYAVPMGQVLPELDELKGGRDVEGVRIPDPSKAMRDLQKEFSSEDFLEHLNPEIRKWIEPFLDPDTWTRREEPGEAGKSLVDKLFEEFFGGRDKDSPAPLDNKAKLGVNVDIPRDGRPGIPIVSVIPRGGAARAGLRDGDRILAVDDERVASLQDIQKILARHEPGDTVQVTALRQGWTKKVRVTLGE